MIDPLLSLAFTLHANKGIHALLLGSGVSRAAGIPTGWEIVLDLINKLAHLQHAECGGDPAAWYVKAHGAEPEYDKLLHDIAKLPAERGQLLRSYFEPSEDERQQGLKLPSAAHRAIAQLVVSGHIRIIITTNFDRLLEMAIEQAGVVPHVIATPDAIEGALPLTHARCLVLKVHGDYLDTRILNTATELSRYDKRLDRLLDQIFDEFGLVVCGWSAEWDVAMRRALQRCKTRRFTTYWCTRGELSSVAQQLATHRQAEIRSIESADAFFRALVEKVAALDEYARSHPLSVAAAAATIKRYLVDDTQRIRLSDLFAEETERVYASLDRNVFPADDANVTIETFMQRVRRYEAIVEVLQTMLAVGGDVPVSVELEN